MNKGEVLVSICCITYNHEPYIRQCLEGFMMQQTNFSFEILIHDDASTDQTAEIICEYEKKYPDIQGYKELHTMTLITINTKYRLPYDSLYL